MAKFELIGKIEKLGTIQQVPTQNGGIAKCEIIITTARFDPYTGEPSDNPDHIALEFSGKNVDKLSGFKVGDMVVVPFRLAGRNYTDKQGAEKNFTKVVGYDIQPYQTRRSPATIQAATPVEQKQEGAMYQAPEQTDNNDLPF